MNSRDAIFTIRFVGPELKRHGMPIYELGAAFIRNSTPFPQGVSRSKGAADERKVSRKGREKIDCSADRRT